MSEFDRSKWNRKFREDLSNWTIPSKVVMSLASYLPESGEAIDVAGGVGRHSIWLAQQGLSVTLADISSVALAHAKQTSQDLEVGIRTLEVDLEQDGLPVGPWDLIFSHHFLYRPLFCDFVDRLSPGGRLIVVQPTEVNLERHPKPPKPFVLEPRELRSLASSLSIIHYEEGWLAEGRHEAILVAEK